MMIRARVLFGFLFLISNSCRSAVAKHQQQRRNQKSQEAIDYWTTHGGFESAEPYDMQEIHLDDENDFLRRQLLRGGGGGGSRVLQTTSEPLAGDGDWDNRDTPVMHAAGRLYFVVNGAGKVCSATTVTDQTTGRSIAISAGHCVYDSNTKEFAQYMVFVPMQDDGGEDKTNNWRNPDCDDDPYGCWVADFAIVQDCWAEKTWPTNAYCDWAFLVFPDTGAHLHNDVAHPGVPEALDQAVPTLAIDFSGYNDCENNNGVLMGYSYSEDPHFRYCHVEGMFHFETTAVDYGYMLPGCGMSGGASGGPGMRGCNLGFGPITHVVSWGATYSNGNKVMGGPILGDTRAECGFEMAKNVAFDQIANGRGIVIESDDSDTSNGCRAQEGYLLSTTSGTEASPTTPVALPEVLVWDDDFETDFGNWNDGGADVARIRTQRWNPRPNWASEVQPVVGSWAIRIRDNTYLQASLTSNVMNADNTPELRGRTRLRVEFDYIVESFEGGESFFVELCEGDLGTFCPNVQGFQRVQFSNDVHFNDNGSNSGGPPPLAHYFGTSVEFNIPPGPTAGFILRFRCHASGNGDRLYIGGVRVYALP